MGVGRNPNGLGTQSEEGNIMRKDAIPSELFLGAIKRGYIAESQKTRNVTCSAIWDHVCFECLQMPSGFLRMFEWDTSRAQHINRIGTIQECIERGLVPGLRLVAEGGRLYVQGC